VIVALSERYSSPPRVEQVIDALPAAFEETVPALCRASASACAEPDLLAALIADALARPDGQTARTMRGVYFTRALGGVGCWLAAEMTAGQCRRPGAVCRPGRPDGDRAHAPPGRDGPAIAQAGEGGRIVRGVVLRRDRAAIARGGGPAMTGADAEPAVSVRGLTVIRGGVTILHDISLEVPAGTLYGLVGPSGCGKTTLMRSIVGRQRIARGEVHALGEPAGATPLRRAIGYMPQNAAVYPDLTARENLEFFAAIYRVPRGRVDEVLRLVDLTAIAGRVVASFSGGERQRVALASALLPSPRLLVLDEPTVGLDPRLRRRLWSQFRAWAAAGTTLLVSTHVMDEAAHTERLAFLLEGRIFAEGTPSELLARTGASNLEDAVFRLSKAEPPAAVKEATP
jgi:ABC-2 type transport system ATP-binding protein